MVFVYRVITFYDLAFQTSSTNDQICNSLNILPHTQCDPTTPLWHRRQAVPP